MGASIPPLVQGCEVETSARHLGASTDILETVGGKFGKLGKKLTRETGLLVPTYLGNDQRRFYGRGTPQGLNLIDKFYLGSGKTWLGRFSTWQGAGWTGQPTIVRDGGKTYLAIGAFDHHLRKIDLESNKEVWRYKFDDVIKGTATIYIDPTASEENQLVILQGSRRGNQNDLFTSNPVTSFRAISFRTGRELWKLNIRKTDSYSRDNDSSAIDLGNGILFNAGENSIGYFLNSSTKAASVRYGVKQPEILSEVQLYEAADIRRHAGNLVAEASPSRLGDTIFIAAGAGHIYGISLKSRQIIWDFFTGSDMDGTIAISKDEKLFCTIEKQYIPGNGGVIKLNPSHKEEDSVEWFLPTGNRKFASWEGGIIGSAALNDEYRLTEPALFATNSIDGNLYIGSQSKTTGQKVTGHLGKRKYDTPLILFKKRIGASISTPIFTDGNKLIAAGYDGVYMFDLNFEPTNADDPQGVMNDWGEFYRLKVEQSGRFLPGISFEATPVVWEGKVYICARDGWMYALG